MKPVAYDWNDLTLEVYRIYAPMGYGGLLEKVMISVRKPGTDEIIDRVHFADSLWKGEQYWTIVRRFMHEGPGRFPDFYYAPTDWHCDDPHNPFERLLPKVNWPTEMDQESRTATPLRESSHERCLAGRPQLPPESCIASMWANLWKMSVANGLLLAQ